MTDESEQEEVVEPNREYNRGRADAISGGVKIVGKVKRGTDTRDQDTLKIEARGPTHAEASQQFEAALDQCEDGDWPDRLRQLEGERLPDVATESEE